MNLEDKKRIVEEMCDGIKKTMLDALPYVPKEWNGYELRQLLADLADEKYAMKMTAVRHKRYRDERRINSKL